MTATALSLAGQVLALLEQVDHVNVMDGRVVLPTYSPAKPETHRFWDLDAAGQAENVHAYAVLYPGAGNNGSLTLDQEPDTLTWGCQVTCVGGDRTRALWCIGEVRSVLAGARLLNAAGQSVLLVEPDGYDPGPLREDTDVSPSRHYLPLQFTTTA